MASTKDDKGFDSVEVRHRSIEEVGNQAEGKEVADSKMEAVRILK